MYTNNLPFRKTMLVAPLVGLGYADPVPKNVTSIAEQNVNKP